MAEYNPSKIIKDGNTYNFRDNTKIPLAGSNQISGDLIPATDITYNLGSNNRNYSSVYAYNFPSFMRAMSPSDTTDIFLIAGTDVFYGAYLQLSSKDTTSGSVAGSFRLTARDSSNQAELIGTPNGTLTWGSKNVAMQEDVVPRSGGGVMIGSALGRIINTSEFRIDGGTTWNDGASIVVAGKGNNGIIKLHPSTVNQEKTMNLYPDGTWTWTGSACVISSDRRIKDEISEIPDEVLDAWENLEPKQYKLKSDLENDKDNAQVHYGWIAQDVESVIKGDRKAEVKNGLWSHEQWEEQEEVSHEETYTEEVETKSGEKQTVIKTRKVIDQPYKAKGDSYSLRYTECLVVECAYLRKKNKELQEQLDKLASRLDKLESASSK